MRLRMETADLVGSASVSVAKGGGGLCDHSDMMRLSSSSVYRFVGGCVMGV